MADLYLVWGGLPPGLFPWGIRCSTQLPNFEQPQIDLWHEGGLEGVNFPSGASMLALSDRILLVAGYQYPGYDIIQWAYCTSWPHWVETATPASIGPSASNGNPALANWDTGALAVWNGISDDTRIWCSQYNQSQNAWSPQYLTKLAGTNRPIQSGASPAILSLNGVLFMVWRGEGNNESLYYATSTDGYTWVGNWQIAGANSSHQPALINFNGYPVLCFKGLSGDGGIYTTTFNLNDQQWVPVVPTGPFGTTDGPTLAVYQGRLFMAWKGDGNDTSLWWATTSNNLDQNAWSSQSNIPGVGSAAQPAAVVY